MRIETPFRNGLTVLIVAATWLELPMPSLAQSAGDAAVSLLDESSLDEPLRAAITATIRNQPQLRQWGGEHDDLLFGAAVRPLPKGGLRKRATPITLSAAQGIAIHEMLITKVVLERYGDAGLTDVDALRQSLLKASSELRVKGRVQDARQEAATQGEFAVGYVVARRDALTAHLLTEANLSAVKHGYRDALHQRLRALMRQDKWGDALIVWQHLDERKLENAKLLLDVAKCFQHQAEPNKSLAALVRARELDADQVTVDFLTELGDVALLLEMDTANDFAEVAFVEALRRFQNK